MAIAWRVGVLLWALYLLTFGGGPHSVDEIGQLAVTASLVERGALDANEIFWTIPAAGYRSDAQVEIGTTGDAWSVRGPTLPLVFAPWYALAMALPRLDLVFTTLAASTFVTALTGALLVRLGARLGLGPRAAAAGGLLYGLTGMAWPYSRLGFGEPTIALMVVVAAATARAGALGAAAAGLAVAAAAGTKPSAVLLGAPLFLYAALEGGRPRWRRAAAFAVAGGSGLAGLAWHNWARYGSPLSTGYDLGGREEFTASPLTGLLGLTVSPYRGVLWFAPLAVAAVALFPLARRRAPGFAWLALSVALVTLLTFVGWWTWWGGHAWGPRFLLPAMPLLTLLVPLAWPTLGRAGRAAVAAAAAVAAVVQLPGVLADFNPFERALRERWPGFPRAGDLWDPATSPILAIGRELLVGGRCAVDLVWLNCARFDPALGAVLGLSAALAALALLAELRPTDRRAARLRGATGLLAAAALLVALAVLLVRGPTPPGADAAALLEAAHRRDAAARPGDATVLLASPEVTALWSHDRSRQPTYGFNRDDLPGNPEARRLLGLAAARHPRLWLLAANVPRHDPMNGVERWLDRETFPVDGLEVGPARLRLFLTGGAPPPAGPPVARFGDGTVRLTGVQLYDRQVAPGEPARVALRWEGDGQPVSDLAVFVHLYAGGELVGQADTPLATALPSGGADVLREAVGRHAPRLGARAVGALSVEVGLYRPASGERLRAVGPGGAPYPDGRVPIGTLTAAR